MHHKEIVESPHAPGAIGPYSQGIKTDKLVFTSGQLPIDPAAKTVPENLQDQARTALANVEAVLAAAGAGLGDVIKTTVFLADIADFAAVNDVYKACFDKAGAHPYPARSAVQVAALPGPKGCRLEIEAIAALPD